MRRVYERSTVPMRVAMADGLQALRESLRAVGTRADDDRPSNQVRNA
jgi:hypothetical protein